MMHGLYWFIYFLHYYDQSVYWAFSILGFAFFNNYKLFPKILKQIIIRVLNIEFENRKLKLLSEYK